MDSENSKALRTGYFTEIAEDDKLKGNAVLDAINLKRRVCKDG